MLTQMINASHMIYKMARKLCGIKFPISEEQALAIAEQYCTEHDWRWDLNEVVILESLRTYEVITNSHHLGGNARITIDVTGGRVLGAAISPD